jgi:hypothetical protein
MYKDTDRQAPLFGVDSSLGDSARRRLEASWAHEFALEVYPVLLEVEREFSGLYGSTGRPNWSVARMLGVCILQEMEGLVDQQAVDALCFDNRWRYALGFEASKDSYLSRQGLVEFRSRIARDDPEMELLTMVFDRLADEGLERLGLSTSTQRLDSTLVQSNIKCRARLDLVATTLIHGLNSVEGADEEALVGLSPELVKWFRTKEEGRGWFGDAGERTNLEQLGQWLFEFDQLFGEDADYRELEPVQLVRRVLHEHFEFEDPDPDPDPEGGGGSSPEARKHSVKIDSPTTLQSPFDPDAGKGHKGQGYMLHIVETCRNESEEKEGPELITGFKLNPANQADQNQAQLLCDRLRSAQRVPSTLFADSGYITPTSLAVTSSHGIRLDGPVNRTRDSDKEFTRLDFGYDSDGKVVRCPTGHAPVDHRERVYESDPDRVLHAFFDPDTCEACEHYDDCPVRLNNGYAFLPLVDRLKRRDARIVEQRDPQWWEAYGVRSGIEATVSELKRRHGCRRLRVRRRPRVKMALIFKLMGCNTKRWTQAQRKPKAA